MKIITERSWSYKRHFMIDETEVLKNDVFSKLKSLTSKSIFENSASIGWFLQWGGWKSRFHCTTNVVSLLSLLLTIKWIN